MRPAAKTTALAVGIMSLVTLSACSGVAQGDENSPVAQPSASTSTVTGDETPAPIPTGGPDLMAEGDRGPEVVALQKVLQQMNLLPEANGRYDAATVQAIKNLQADYGLPTTGSVNQGLWDVLKTIFSPGAKTEPSKPVPTKVTPSKATRPTSTPPPTPTPTQKATPTKKATPTAKPTQKAQPKLDPRCYRGRVMCVSKKTNRLYWVVDGQVQDDWSVRLGRPGLETREGTFSVFRKEEKSWSYLYEVWMPYSMYFSGGQAVHYSSDFARNGYSNGGSHGCVNMRDYKGIEWLYGQVRLGDKVVVYR